MSKLFAGFATSPSFLGAEQRWMPRFILLSLMLALGSGGPEAAAADPAPAADSAPAGFALHDLALLEGAARSLGGKQFDVRASAERLTLACADCEGFVAIDVLLGSSSDGTEGRFRGGETPLEQLEAQCRARDEACRLERLDVGAAVGWLSIYSRGSTAVLFRSGDMLTIRGLADDPQVARSYVRAALETLALRIVGP